MAQAWLGHAVLRLAPATALVLLVFLEGATCWDGSNGRRKGSTATFEHGFESLRKHAFAIGKPCAPYPAPPSLVWLQNLHNWDKALVLVVVFVKVPRCRFADSICQKVGAKLNHQAVGRRCFLHFFRNWPGVILFFLLSKEMPFSSPDRDSAATMRKTVKCWPRLGVCGCGCGQENLVVAGKHKAFLLRVV